MRSILWSSSTGVGRKKGKPNNYKKDWGYQSKAWKLIRTSYRPEESLNETWPSRQNSTRNKHYVSSNKHFVNRSKHFSTSDNKHFNTSNSNNNKHFGTSRNNKHFSSNSNKHFDTSCNELLRKGSRK